MSHKFSDNSTVYKSLFEESASIMLIIDHDTGKILDANKAALKFYHYSKKEILDLHISDINTLPPEEVKKMIAKAKEKKNHFNFRHQLKTGEIRDVEVSSGLIDFGDRKALYSIITDVTEIKKDRDALKESERTIRAMINTTNSMVFLFHIDGTIIKVNTAGATMFDKLPEEMVGENCKSFFEENDYTRIRAIADEVARTQRSLNYQRARDDRFYDVNLHPVINKSGEADRICVFVNDITDLKKTEKVLAAIETAGAVCHEMNQPLQVIIGNLELLKMGIEPDSPNLKFIENTLEQAEKIGTITKKLTHITHYETKAYMQGTIFDIDRSSDVK